ncbi:Dihydrolipoyllysine-residue succinyltransferase component of 2-oxoglutarate dehydrogenase complex [Dyadobacter sp. CECT 9275]|uniref:Dihydrolipoamide acetyltransferase component of pyruvate dehydrogenase complex n=2 Tax=Dyadobacter helix TaxID=2822344 RepID=A0A916NEG4_9BACT|nr:Dihydrolipoyllysine-residue succinyltransferase component of 2-oxoglutarate dehydrogenase complex [Dyadobacter sp. CECT 9275]
MGESILECTVLNILRKPGDRVGLDDSILEVATDKVDTEVPCPYNGILVEWLVKENDIVEIGSPVAKIQVQADGVADAGITGKDALVEIIEEEKAAIIIEKELAENVLTQTPDKITYHELGDASTFYSPLVLSIARQENISPQELSSITGTGADNRVTKNDMLAYLKNRNIPASGQQVKTQSVSGQTEIFEMDRMRKMISQRMTESRKISAHVTSFIETDMTPVVNWREAVKQEYRKKSGDSITFTPILIEAVAKAIRDYPLINISVEGDKIIKKKDINIGMAVALPDGNLIVPVIHQADQYDLPALARKVNELAKRARENKLKPDDLAGGTYSVSNIGAFANLMGTPIIVQPQVAIMAFGAIKKKPAVIETPQGDLIGIRSMMFISHSYDHRVVDGSLGGLFLKRVNDYLENFDTRRTLI